MKLAWILLLTPALALGADRPQDFAYDVPIRFDGHEALYELDIPASVYRGVTRHDAGDIRIFNSQGEPVPFAFLPPAQRRAEPSPEVAVRFFPIHGEAKQALDGLQLRVDKNGSTAVVNVGADRPKAGAKQQLRAYVLDTGARTQPYHALELDWRQRTASFAMNVRVDASDDLRTWSNLVNRAPLVRLEHAGERLEQRTIELGTQRARYLRVSFAEAGDGDTDSPLELTAAVVRGAGVVQEQPRNWMESQATTGDQPGEYLFDLGGPYPADRIRVGVTEDNTIAQVELLTRARSSAPWRSVAHTVVYRLTRDGHAVSSPEIAVSGGERYWLLRVDQRGGGLGTSIPVLHAGWIAPKLVFAARGDGPFMLAYGNSRALPDALPIQTVVPGWRSDAPAPLPKAQTLPEHLLGGPTQMQRVPDRKVWVLWSALLIGVGTLGWMAWRLVKQMQGSPPPQPASDGSGSSAG